MRHVSGSSVWPILHYEDTRGALRYLVDVLGFEALGVTCDDDGDVIHAELGWPGGGVVVFGSTKHVDSVHSGMRAGSSAQYVITDDVDVIHARVVQAGGEVVETPHDARFGSGASAYVFTARDPEGTLWTFGTYRRSHHSCQSG
jgi:uncharacterized glyoxalase superfamily protein PhnB